MKHDEFVRKLKPNKESWKVIQKNATQKDKDMSQRYQKILEQLECLQNKNADKFMNSKDPVN
jgi:hypothetical protein